MLALDLTTIDDNGAYVGRGPMQMAKPITAIVGPYRIPVARYTGYSVITNKNNQSPYRGFGQSPQNFVLERSFDRVAASLGETSVTPKRWSNPPQGPMISTGSHGMLFMHEGGRTRGGREGHRACSSTRRGSPSTSARASRSSPDTVG